MRENVILITTNHLAVGVQASLREVVRIESGMHQYVSSQIVNKAIN